MKFLSIILLFITYANAINIEVKNSTNYEISQLDIKNTIKMWKNRNLRIDAKEARKLVLENRVLADVFLDKGYFTDNVKSENKIIYEEKLADILVQNELRKITDTDIPLSYYENNKYEFFKQADIKFKVYAYKTYEEALSCYNENKDNILNLDAYAKDTNATVEEHSMNLKTLHPQLQNLLVDFNTTNYISPPQKFYKNYIVFEVEDIIKEHLQPFSEVEKNIREKLKKRIMNYKRTELVKKYLSKKLK